MLSLVLAMSCMGTALAAEAEGNDTAATTTLTAAEREEQAR